MSRTPIVATLAFALSAACAPAARTPPPPSAVKCAGAAPARTEAAGPRVVVRLNSDEAEEGRVRAELRFEGAAAAKTLRFTPSHGARVETLAVRDANGPVDVETIADGSGARFELARRPAGPLEIRYVVTLATSADQSDEEGGAALAEPVELRGAGEDLLVLPEPEDDAAMPVEVHLRTGGSSIDAASSFGLGLVQRANARMSEMRHAFFLAGDVGTARFHATDGDDVGAWLGPTAFDPRWVSAEIAGIRSAVDEWVGRSPTPGLPPLTYLFSATKRDRAPIVVVPRTRGLLVSADRRAVWDAPARILVAQAMAKRYAGGFLWIGDRKAPASGLFFSEGFSRAIAREVLFDANLLEPVSRAAELNALLSAVAFAEDAERKATASGAIIATALDVALRAESAQKGTPGSLRTFIREALAKAANEGRSELSRAELVLMIRERTNESVARDLSRAIEAGSAGDVALPPDLMGRCFRLTKKLLVPFELGFVTSADTPMVVTAVKPGSRAEAAGLRTGDVVTNLHYEAGKSNVPVEMVVKRRANGDDRSIRIRYTPAGPSRPGRVFERVLHVPDDRC